MPAHRAFDMALVNAAFDAYLHWREQCEVVDRAYERWTSEPHADKGLAFVAYSLALENEERASDLYADRIARARGVEPSAITRAA
jgi:hypothetical protein